MSRPIRVLIVDDSAFARKVLREVLIGAQNLDVVGTARDGLEALEKIAELAPDVITLDLVMPNLDGLGVLAALPPENGPRVVVVSISDGDTELGARALQAGAVEIIRKPTALATDQLYDLRDELVAKITLAASARAHPVSVAPGASVAQAPLAHRHSVIVIGTSTGGPQAITRLIQGLPGNLPVPVVVALHIPEGYTQALAARIDAHSALDVREAVAGMSLRAGRCIIARGGAHLRLAAGAPGPHVELDFRRGQALHMPSVDLLFDSAAAVYGAATMGIVLTGMGDDGSRGAGTIRRAGGTVIAESERSCVVYGMPRCVIEAGMATSQVPLDEMVMEILRQL